MTFLRDAGGEARVRDTFPGILLQAVGKKKRAVNQKAGSVAIIRGADCIIESFNKEVVDGIVGYCTTKRRRKRKKKEEMKDRGAEEQDGRYAALYENPG